MFNHLIEAITLSFVFGSFFGALVVASFNRNRLKPAEQPHSSGR